MPPLLRSLCWFALSVCLMSVLGCGSDSTETTSDEPVKDSDRGIAYRTEPLPADPDAPEEYTETESGLSYRILRPGTGEKPKRFNRVFVHYAGWLEDGSEFDTTYDDGSPIDFRLNSVIPGWAEGIQLIGKGGMVEFIVPPEIGYGEEGIPGEIPPNATLRFKVELIAIF